MLITKKHVFVHIPKTAGKAVLEFLVQGMPQLTPHPDFVALEWRNIRHLPLRERYQENKHKKIFCTIRNPWDWNVSKYFYNILDGQGTRETLKASGKDVDLGKTYEPPAANKKFMSKNMFSEYIKFLFCTDPAGPDFQIPNVGQLTHAYFNMCAKQEIPKRVTKSFLYETHDNIIGVDKVIKMENLQDDLSEFLEIPKTTIPVMNRWQDIRKHYSHYYDDEAREIIAEKESFIINKFDYDFEQQ